MRLGFPIFVVVANVMLIERRVGWAVRENNDLLI